MHCRYDSSHASPMHTDTSHTRGCAFGRYENWPQRWPWIVIPASAATVTPNESEHELFVISITCSRQNMQTWPLHYSQQTDKLHKLFAANHLPKRHTEAVNGKYGPSLPSRRIMTTFPNSWAITNVRYSCCRFRTDITLYYTHDFTSIQATSNYVCLATAEVVALPTSEWALEPKLELRVVVVQSWSNLCLSTIFF